MRTTSGKASATSRPDTVMRSGRPPARPPCRPGSGSRRSARPRSRCRRRAARARCGAALAPPWPRSPARHSGTPPPARRRAAGCAWRCRAGPRAPLREPRARSLRSPSRGPKRRSHQRRCGVATPSRTRTKWPGASSWMPGKALRSGCGAHSVKVSSTANGSMRRSDPGCRSSALASDAKARSPPNSARNSGPDAEPVARQEELPRRTVPDREGELAVEPVEAALAPLLVGVNDDLGIGAGGEAVPESAKLLGELRVVVDLAVLHDPQPAVLVRERLVAAREIDDGEARVDHAEAAVEVQTDTVGTAVEQLAGHRQQNVAGWGSIGGGVDACDAAHGVKSALPRGLADRAPDVGRPG